MTVCRTLTSDFTNGEHLTSFFKFRFLLLWTAHVANCVQRKLLEDEYSSERKRKKFGKFVTENLFLETKTCPKRADFDLFHFVLCSCVPQTRKSQQGNVPSPIHMRIDTECECERVNFKSPGNLIPTLPPPIRSLEPVCVCARAKCACACACACTFPI